MRCSDAQRSRMVCMSWAVIWGARPRDGSSSSSTRGLAIRARAIASIWRSPPDKVAQSLRRRSRSAGNLSYCSFSPAARSTLAAIAPSRRFSSTVSSAMTPRPSGTWARPIRAMFSVATPVSRTSSRKTSPVLGVTRPEIVRSNVVLPAPFAPSTAVISPVGASKETSRSARTAP